MIKNITEQKLTELIANNKTNANLPVMTDTVFIALDHFNEFLRGLPQECDALKICFVRFPANPKDPGRILEAGNNLTQLSLVIIPVKATNSANWSSTDATDKDGNLRALCVCEPGIDDNNGTGLIPPKGSTEKPSDGLNPAG